MALYRIGSLFQRGTDQFNNGMQAMGQRTKENQTTEYEAPGLSTGDYVARGIGAIGTVEQLYELGNKAVKGWDWMAGKWGAPNAVAQAANAGAGAQAVQQGSGIVGQASQMNTGAVITPQDIDQIFYEPQGSQAIIDEVATKAAAGQTPAIGEGAGHVAQSAASQAQGVAQGAGSAAQGGLTGLGAVAGPALGGLAGGYAGKELGKAIGGKEGEAIGGVAGSLGGAYLGGMAASSIAGSLAGAGAGATAGAATGAAAGSFVPGVGTLIGAGIGALASFFL